METDNEDHALHDAVMAIAIDMGQDSRMALPSDEVESAIQSEITYLCSLDGDLVWAIRRATGPDKGRFVVVDGPVGHERSVLIGMVAGLYQDNGYRSVCVAVTAESLDNLGADCGRWTRPYLLEELLAEAARGPVELDDHTVVFVAQGDLMSMRQSHDLMQLAAQYGTKIIFVGKGYEI